MKKILLCGCLLLTTTLFAQEKITTASSENSPKEDKIPVAIGIQGSYLFHMYNNNVYTDYNSIPLDLKQFDHGGVGLNITIGSPQKFHTVIYGGLSFYQNVNMDVSTLDNQDVVGGKLNVDFIPVNVKLGQSLSTFYIGLGLGFDLGFDTQVYNYSLVEAGSGLDGGFYCLLSLRVPVGFAFRVSQLVELYVQNAFQFGADFTSSSIGSTVDFSITSDLEFGIKFWVQ